MLSWRSSLYTLDTNFLSDTSFANIFSHLVGYLFVLFPLLCKNFLVWCSPNSLFLCFLPEETYLKNIKDDVQEITAYVFFEIYGFRSHI